MNEKKRKGPIRRFYLQMVSGVQYHIGFVLSGGRLWGILRLIVVAGIILLLANWGRYTWNEEGSEPASLIWWWGLRYWVMPLTALLGAFLLGGWYVKRLSSLRSQRRAMQYLFASAFSLGIPELVIKDGQPTLAAGKENLILNIGGPGCINVRPGSAVVVETLQQPTRVLGAGLHNLTRLERLRDFISLADQHGMTEEVTASTKDGIELNLMRIQYRYRLLTGRQPRDFRKRTLEDPYPFSPDAARKMAYLRTAFANGAVTPWDGIVKFAVEGVVTDFVNENLMDKFATPDKYTVKQQPRQIINDKLMAKTLRERLRTGGTELLWFDIGSFEPKMSDVDAQWVNTWGAKWSGIAALEQAKAEGERLSVQEIARAEAQAKILESIMVMFKDVSLTPNYRENIHKLIVLRTAQILETMVESNPLVTDRDVPKQPLSIARRREFLQVPPMNSARRLKDED